MRCGILSVMMGCLYQLWSTLSQLSGLIDSALAVCAGSQSGGCQHHDGGLSHLAVTLALLLQRGGGFVLSLPTTEAPEDAGGGARRLERRARVRNQERRIGRSRFIYIYTYTP